MSNCSICGRALSNPASIAAGVGPICGGRGYRNRIAGRFGNPRWGWSEIAEWEVVNHPCYSCKHFRFPNKGKELTLEDGNRRVSFPAKDPYTGKRPLNRATGREEIKTFPPKAIGGLCRYLNENWWTATRFGKMRPARAGTT